MTQQHVNERELPENDNFDDEFFETAETIGSLKRKLLMLEKQRETMTTKHDVAMDCLSNKHQMKLNKRRRQHAQEISLLETRQMRERVELMKKNKNDSNEMTVCINHVKTTLNSLKKNLKRKFRDDNEDDDIPECPVCKVPHT